VIRDDNKGQYELVQTYEEDTLRELDKDKDHAAENKSSKKKVYQLKIGSGNEDNPEEFDNIVEEDEQEVLVKPDKNSRSFKKLFFSFWKNRDEKQTDHESLIQVLSEDAEISNKEINSGSIKSKDKKSEGTDNNE